MSELRDLSELRAEIDIIDNELIRLFVQRMNVAGEVAAYKKSVGKPVFDPVREQAKLDDIASKLPEDMREDGRRLYACIFELSRGRQTRLMGGEDDKAEGASI